MMLVEMTTQVGRPKFLFPISEKAWPVIFRRRVHRITSQGAEPVSSSAGAPAPGNAKLAIDECREWLARNAGDVARGELKGDDESLDWNLRSKGRCAPLGLLLREGLRYGRASL